KAARRLRVHRRSAAERRATARRLGTPALGLVETLAAPVASVARLLVLLDVELRVGDRPENLALARQFRAVDVPFRVPEVGAGGRLRALRGSLRDLQQG